MRTSSGSVPSGGFWLGIMDFLLTHLAAQHGFEGYAGYEVGPDDVQHLQDQQQRVEEPPGRVRPDDGPALKQGGVQDPGGGEPH